LFREQYPAGSRRSLEAFHRLTKGEQSAARNYGCSIGGVRHRRKGSCHDCRAIVDTACRLLLGRLYHRRRLPRRPHSDTHTAAALTRATRTRIPRRAPPLRCARDGMFSAPGVAADGVQPCVCVCVRFPRPRYRERQGHKQKAAAIARCGEAQEAVYRQALLQGPRLLRHVLEAGRGATRRSASPFARAWNVLGLRHDCASKGSRVLEEHLMRRRMTRAQWHVRSDSVAMTPDKAQRENYVFSSSG
jgi:hypothetical protein